MATTGAPGSSKSGKSGGEEKEDNPMFECNICLDTAKNAVVSMCGHLFCWPCLHQWLETRPNRQLCPVCKAAIGKDKVIPLYGRGSNQQEDPRNKVPPRPAGQRIEPENTNGFPGFGFGDGGFHMSFGIGAFPFGFFQTSSYNLPDQRASQDDEDEDGSNEEEEEEESDSDSDIPSSVVSSSFSVNLDGEDQEEFAMSGGMVADSDSSVEEESDDEAQEEEEEEDEDEEECGDSYEESAEGSFVDLDEDSDLEDRVGSDRGSEFFENSDGYLGSSDDSN